jgi:hypothetical protein
LEKHHEEYVDLEQRRDELMEVSDSGMCGALRCPKPRTEVTITYEGKDHEENTVDSVADGDWFERLLRCAISRS